MTCSLLPMTRAQGKPVFSFVCFYLKKHQRYGHLQTKVVLKQKIIYSCLNDVYNCIAQLDWEKLILYIYIYIYDCHFKKFVQLSHREANWVGKQQRLQKEIQIQFITVKSPDRALTHCSGFFKASENRH